MVEFVAESNLQNYIALSENKLDNLALSAIRNTSNGLKITLHHGIVTNCKR